MHNKTITVNMGNENYITLPLDNSNVKVDIQDNGAEQIVNINVIDTITNKPSGKKYKMTDVPTAFNIDLKNLGDKKIKDAKSQGNDDNFLELSLTGIGAITGGTELRLAKKLRSFRPIRYNNGGLFRQGTIAENVSSRGLMSGSRHLQTLRGTLYWTGVGASVAGGAYSIYSYSQGEISGEKLAMDLIMTGVGFAGPVGLGISVAYFILTTPVPNIPTPDFIANPLSDYNRCSRIDNTRVSNPYIY